MKRIISTKPTDDYLHTISRQSFQSLTAELTPSQMIVLMVILDSREMLFSPTLVAGQYNLSLSTVKKAFSTLMEKGYIRYNKADKIYYAYDSIQAEE